jgi:hypothetical protein
MYPCLHTLPEQRSRDGGGGAGVPGRGAADILSGVSDGRDDPAGTRASAPTAYCRQCGYSLRGLPSGKCPECGGAFDWAGRKTFARRPPRWWLWRYVRRVAVVGVLLALAAASVPAWYYSQWRAEQRSLDTIRALGGRVVVRRVDAEGLARYLPERWAFLRDRAWNVELNKLTVEQAARLDLRPLARLQYLSLEDAPVNDSRLAQLRDCTELKLLILTADPLDGSGFAHLTGCRRLVSLRLSRTRLDDAGLAHVARLTSLRQLFVDGTAVTDAGMSRLAGLTSLQTLDLSSTAVSDAGLSRLRGLTSLKLVHVHGSGVTARGRRDLQRSLPNIKIRD